MSSRKTMSRGPLLRRIQALSPFACRRVRACLCAARYLWLAACMLPAFFAACHKTGDVGAILWEGSALNPEREMAGPSALQLKAEGFPDMEPLPVRFLALNQGSLKILEFPGDAEAYAAFEQLADPAELADGFVQRQDTVFFRKGTWLGEWLGSGKGPDGLRSKLQLPGSEDWGALPEGFASLLHQGRIYQSERVVMGNFLGLSESAPIFTARFDCRGDSAWIYSSPRMPLNFAFEAGKRSGYRLDSSGAEKTVTSKPGWKSPLRLDFFKSGMAGVEGCFDDSLTIHWVEIQKKALKSLKLRG